MFWPAGRYPSTLISTEDKPMPGEQPNKNYKRFLSITLISLCLITPLAPALLGPGRPVSAQSQGLLSLNSCSANQSFEATMFAVTVNNTLLNFNPGTPGVINSSRRITGLARGEDVVGIDFRPANGQLYALTSANRLYTINPSNAFATPVGAPFTPGLNGAKFGFDFNPVPDRIRLVSNADQNLRLNPNNGAIAGMDGTLAFAAGDPNAGQDPNIVSSAYTNNFAGSTSTTLYRIDSNLDALVTQGSVGSAPVSPNSGQLFTVGKLNVDTSDMVGFDIAPATNAAFASLTPPNGGASTLYTINLATGAATPIGPIGGRQLIRDIAFAVRAENIFAVTASNKLIRFNPGVPGAINNSRAIRGLGSGENIVGIDFRPATGILFALSDASRLYTINTTNGMATPVGGGPFTPGLNGTNFGFNFNPTSDKIRTTSDGDQTLRLDPNNGAVAGMDGTLAFAAGDPNAGQNPNVVGAAYTNSFLGASSTTLYGIDSNLNALVTQGSVGGAPVSPNTGQLFTVGSLGVTTTGSVGFDIATPTNAAFASLTPPNANQSQFYSINLATGAATRIGGIPIKEVINGIAIGGVSRRGFDVCLQDDRSGDSLQFDTCTGDYQFSKGGAGAFILTGRGITSLQGNVVTLRGDKNVFAIANVNPGATLRSGTALVRAGRLFVINDKDTTNNACGGR